MTDHTTLLAASSIATAADIGVVNDHREALVEWLEARCQTSPTVIALLLTVLLGECLVASQTAVRSPCDDPGCPDCGQIPVALTPVQVADAVMLVFARLKRMLPTSDLTDLQSVAEALEGRLH